MQAVVDVWHERAHAVPRRIVLADQGDQRASLAAERLRAERLVEPIVIGEDLARLDEVESDRVHEVLDDAHTRAELSGRPFDSHDPLTIAAVLVAAGWADGAVGGASRPTSDVARAGLRVLGVAEGVSTVSSSFVFVLSEGRPIAFGDCGVVPLPDADQLESIAIATATTFEGLIGEPAEVAMLSFSTKGSAEGPTIDVVRDATALVRDRAPELPVDGELQFDAAWDAHIASVKAPDSPVAGQANVFVFPNLDAANIAYKITERLAGARAFGPLLQGLDGVLHDLSRGCSVDDIVNVAVIASLQATARGAS